MGAHFQLNGKFLAAPPTGVHRVAGELANALAGLIAAGHPAARGLSLEALVPRDGLARAKALRLPVRELAPLAGIPWEQLTLPLAHRGEGRGTLLNLCNIGPVLARDAVTMIHDVQVLLSPGSYTAAFRAWYRLVQPALARRHRLLLTVSAYSRAQIVAAGLAPPERIAVVPNGVDHVLATPADPAILARLDLNSGTGLASGMGLNAGGYVLALANTQAHKNVGLLLRAFARPELADLKLVLFGAQDRAAFVRAGHPVPANAVFAGRTSDGELRALMEQALCLAFPSTTEGFGLPPLEAMLLGCPAIVAPCGALPEVCGGAALTAPEDDPAAWAGLIAALARDSALRAALARAGRQRAAGFTWQRSAIVLAEVLGSLHLRG
ncbi:glycosyltransferase family 4 protein [Novosphingobium bradum]|uniref:Glycosyltransferase family 4 protein n=1 Tax=Novosphingobium bradum TaxID=1737444 RepID=A0ABV7ILF6_9SPHN